MAAIELIPNYEDQDERKPVQYPPIPYREIPNPDNVQVEDSDYTPPPRKLTVAPPDAGGGAPVDFNGPVFPNDQGIQARWDEEGPPPDPTTVDSKMTYVSREPSGPGIDIAPPQDQGKVSAPAIETTQNAPAIQTGQTDTTPHKGAIASLWTKAENINNPVLRVLGKIGAGALRAIDTAGAIAAPGIDAAIPGTELNTRLGDVQEMGRRKQEAGIAKTQADTGAVASENAERGARTNLYKKQAEAYGQPKARYEKTESGAIVELSPGANGETSAKVVYQGDPKVETEIRQVMKDGKPRQVLFNKKSGQEIKDLGEAPPAPTLLTQESWRDMTPAEVSAAGMPRGTTAQRNNRGEIKIVGKGNEAKSAQAEASLQNMEANLDRLAASANEVLNHPGLGGITGIRGKIPNIPGTDAANAAAKLETLKSQIGFGVLQDMRNSSKTGGALGAVSDAEGKRLESNLAALDTAQSTEEFKKSLQQIIDYAQGAKDRARAAYESQYGNGEPVAGFSVPTGAPAAPKEDGHKLKSNGKVIAISKGGQWVAP